MSAIWGIVALRPNRSLPADCAQLFEAAYRSNCNIDRYESVFATDALFGCGIQYITKESEHEQLPFYNTKRGILFTADCILDNRAELIKLLSSNGFAKGELAGAPDGTLLYFAYLTFGNACVTRFRGLFSFAVWEECTRTLTLFSDHTAARSLYYTRQDGLLAFSTRMEPLLKLFPNAAPNTAYYKDFLLANPSTIYVVPGETPYREISLLPPATRLCLNENDTASLSYWTPGSTQEVKCSSQKEYSARFLTLYKDCVRDALRTTGEIGIAMSSGLDSASVGVLTAKELAKAGKELYSYTFVPYYQKERRAGSPNVYDESVLVREIAKQYPNIKTTFLNNQGKNLFADMKLCSSILELPYKTGTFPNHYEMYRAGAAGGCRVFLNGAFGNRTVSFGHIHNILYDLYRKRKVFSFLSLVNRYAKHTHISRKKMLLRALQSFRSFCRYRSDPFAHFVPANGFLSPALLRDYDLQQRFSKDPYALISGGYVDRESFRRQLNSANLLMYLGVFETQFGLRTGMLVRDPTKDIRLMEFCYHLPFRLFAHRGTPRWLVRGAFPSLLPASVLEPWEQHGVLNADWIQRVRRDWAVLKPELLRHLSTGLLDDFIDKDRVLSFIEAFDNTEREDAAALVHLCALEGLLRFLLPEPVSGK